MGWQMEGRTDGRDSGRRDDVLVLAFRCRPDENGRSSAEQGERQEVKREGMLCKRDVSPSL